MDEVATELGLARMTVRQHLNDLERDNLVQVEEVRRPTGRPHYRYTLTEKGEETFPKRYDFLATMLLQEVVALEPNEIQGLSPSERQRLLLRRIADRMASQYIPSVEGKPLEQQVEAVTTILQQEGGFAEWRPTDDGYEITDYNCVYRRIAAAHGEICQWHLQFLSRLLDRDVKCDQYISRGANHCRFLVNVD